MTISHDDDYDGFDFDSVIGVITNMHGGLLQKVADGDWELLGCS